MNLWDKRRLSSPLRSLHHEGSPEPVHALGKQSLFKEFCPVLKYIILILLALWLLGFVVFKVAGALIHVLLFVAIVIGLYQLFFAKRGGGV